MESHQRRGVIYQHEATFFLTGLLLTRTQEVQSIVYVVVLLVGCFMVMSGDMTTGALVGTTILASRTIAPLSQISGVLSRAGSRRKWRVTGFDELMKRPVDQPEHGKLVHKAVLHGNYQFSNAVFYYDEEEKCRCSDWQTQHSGR